jgi:hypothetical protein
MRVVFQCYSIYWAFLVTEVTLFISMGFAQKTLNWILMHNVKNIELMLGPVLLTICVYGLTEIKGISTVCTIQGIQPDQTNCLALFLVLSTLTFSVLTSYQLAFRKSYWLSRYALRNENSVVNKIIQIYYIYLARHNESITADRARTRRHRREERDAI